MLHMKQVNVMEEIKLALAKKGINDEHVLGLLDTLGERLDETEVQLEAAIVNNENLYAANQFLQSDINDLNAIVFDLSTQVQAAAKECVTLNDLLATAKRSSESMQEAYNELRDGMIQHIGLLENEIDDLKVHASEQVRENLESLIDNIETAIGGYVAPEGEEVATDPLDHPSEDQVKKTILGKIMDIITSLFRF